MTWRDGSMYKEDWVNDYMEGNGVMRYADESVYAGQRHDDKRTGIGTMIWLNGDRYEGDWMDDCMDGNGVITYADGSVYNEQWIINDRSRMGSMTWPNGEKFVGIWLFDTIISGVYTWTNGQKYEGFIYDAGKSGSAFLQTKVGGCYLKENGKTISSFLTLLRAVHLLV
ncbi:hypothetical protein AGMMS49949_05540 [Alphaproteobacteria bacterium]|nr:hypothetical protein AGMMS49949_05540 [Alphaproteobacteria bacterium]GHS97751.1 hypothetical protein AGMMS50296_5000 [Alphaproteobacteria bacterium]